MKNNLSESVKLKEAARFYDAVTPVFDHDFYGSNADPSLAFDVEEIWKILKSHIHSGDKILEIGCGNGHWMTKLEREIGVQAYGIDISQNMIGQAHERGLNKVVVAEASALPFASSSFNAVISPLNALDHCVQYMKAFIDIDRILIKGGIALLMLDNKDRFIDRYWHLDAPGIQSLKGDPRTTELWTHLVNGEEVTIYSHFYTIAEIENLLPEYEIRFRGLGVISPLVPRFLRKAAPKGVKTLLNLIRWLEQFLCIKFPQIAAHLFVIATKRSSVNDKPFI